MKHWIIFTWLLKFLNCLTPKDKKSIVFLPHHNGKADGYDIINYRSDNVLCLFNYIIRTNEYNDHHLILFYYDKAKKLQYENYVREVNANINVTFVDYSEINVVRTLLKSWVCFTDQAYYNFRFKLSKQRFICLGYFTPFKRDYLWSGAKYGYVSHNAFMCEFLKHEQSFDSYITTSDVASRVLSIDTGISYYKFEPLGMPRNMVFRYPTTECKVFLQDFFGIPFKKLILYTPTFRDYDENEELSILGYTDDLLEVEKILESNDAILIAKLHPKKKFVKDINKKTTRIFNYNSLPSNYSLYDYLSISDVLVTDYTSTYFDFLYADKPVIFNNYDFDKYYTIRGFSYNPIAPFCAGYMVDTFKDFCIALQESLITDIFKDQRKCIHGIMNTAPNENVCPLICSKFLN